MQKDRKEEENDSNKTTIQIKKEFSNTRNKTTTQKIALLQC